MDELHAACDKLFTEIDHLDRIVEGELSSADAALALAVAKKVTRNSRLVVRHLAAIRDNELQPMEAQAHD